MAIKTASPEILTVAPAVVGQWLQTRILNFNMAATGNRKMQTRGFLPAISYATLNNLSALNKIKKRKCGKGKFYEVERVIEKRKRQNTVSVCVCRSA